MEVTNREAGRRPSAFKHPGVGSFCPTQQSLHPQENWMSQQRRKRRPPETWTLPRWCRKPRISVSGDPCMGCLECNLVLSLTKSNMGHGDNQAFILWNNLHHRLACYLPYQVRAFRLAWADDRRWCLGLSFAPLPFFLSLSSPVKLCGRRRVLGLIAGHMSGWQSYMKSLLFERGNWITKCRNMGAGRDFLLTLASASEGSLQAGSSKPSPRGAGSPRHAGSGLRSSHMTFS